jgi:hypothetical protein
VALLLEWPDCGDQGFQPAAAGAIKGPNGILELFFVALLRQVFPGQAGEAGRFGGPERVNADFGQRVENMISLFIR